MVNRFISSLLFLAAVNTGIVRAQVVPDGTLPTVVEQLENMRKITGGERVGNNLFHSFEEFSIPEGIEAIFENGLDIENIFTRITGSDISVIDGLLKTAGGANFFLINPNGIVFGENAQLDIGGSFIATTANRIEFADGTNFDGLGDEPKVTLTISVPIGIRLDGNNGSITVNGAGHQIVTDSLSQPTNVDTTANGLQVDTGQTLALVGNNVNIDGGIVTADGGRIEIGSVRSGLVGLESYDRGLQLNYDKVSYFGNMQMLQQTLIDASGTNAGSIAVFGADVLLANGSKILLQNQGEIPSGNLQVNATSSLVLDGTNFNGEVYSGVQTETISSGKAGDIAVNTQRIMLRGGARIGANTYSEALGGNVTINASDSVEVLESSSNIINASTYASGNAGSVELSTDLLRVIDGGGISSSTLGTGAGGNISVEANTIELIGGVTEPNNLSSISAVSFGATGNAGNIAVNTHTLKIIDGGAVSTTSIGNGAAGNVKIDASDIIEVSGQNDNFPSAISSGVITEGDPAFRSQRGIPKIPGGNSGNVSINTSLLQVNKGGEISVENGGTGNAGTLSINTDNLNLGKSGRIAAGTASGTGGNIELKSQNLNITNDSQITATVGSDGDGGNITINTTNLTAKKNNQITASADSGDGGNIILNADSVSLNDRDEISAASISGDGGNININTDILTALEQSRITASAISGDGGNITINSPGYFVSEDSVVSASSQFGLDGTININSLENNFQQDLEEPEVEITIIPDFFIPRCANPDRAYLTLFPGEVLPESPDNYYSYPSQTDTDVVLQEPEYQEKLERIVQRYESRLESEPEPEPEIEEPESESEPESGLIWQPGDPMINATEIVETEDGEVFLVPPAEKQEFLRLLRCGQSVN